MFIDSLSLLLKYPRFTFTKMFVPYVMTRVMSSKVWYSYNYVQKWKFIDIFFSRLLMLLKYFIYIRVLKCMCMLFISTYTLYYQQLILTIRSRPQSWILQHWDFNVKHWKKVIIKLAISHVMTSHFCAGFALKLDEESAIFKSQYAENYTVAWAPDCSFLAWSQGGGIVYLLPWDRQCAKMCVASEYSV